MDWFNEEIAQWRNKSNEWRAEWMRELINEWNELNEWINEWSESLNDRNEWMKWINGINEFIKLNVRMNE